MRIRTVHRCIVTFHTVHGNALYQFGVSTNVNISWDGVYMTDYIDHTMGHAKTAISAIYATPNPFRVFLGTFQFIATNFHGIQILSRRPSARSLLLAGLACYGIAELTHYWKFVLRYHRFNGMRVANHTREQVAQAMDRIIACTPGIFQRSARYSTLSHLTDRESLIDAMCVDGSAPPDSPETSAYQLVAGRSRLSRQYKPVLFHWIRRTIYHAGTIAMHRAGYTSQIHATEIGDYTVWTRLVPNSKPIVMFPGFGLGAVPYYSVMCHFGRTVYLVELPNLGYNTPSNSPGYMTSETIYRVVRAHVGDEPHDVVAHSLGSTQAAHYINYQHTHDTTPPNQTAVICDGFVCPVDCVVSHIYPVANRYMYRELMRYRDPPASWWEFSNFVRFVAHDLDGTIFCKRFHNFYEGVLWRDNYKTDIRYVFGERDMLYDVPFIKSVVSQSYVERKKYLFIPKAKHGACFFGKRRNETLNCIGGIGGMLSPRTPCGANVATR